ncbi:MAG: Aconitate hydratase [uncultured Rubrobacteraceae bacterium]|uniref:Aconitate hydratase A n=1 Tax=uncultured Rubrobacteraceae bacterium TaxID=349277 RepID=A0A6J4TR68_9ACTN|nr:MAG: Aconitate hydratase [uncultured Rubrobacteraceae bacterium]
MANDPFDARTTLNTGSGEVDFYSLKTLDEKVDGDVFSLPFSIRVMLESLLRNAGGKFVSQEDVEALANWPESIGGELAYLPARVVMQDFTGVPAIVDLAAMRSAMQNVGGDPKKINPLVPVDLVIDHSVQVDAFGNAAALQFNAEREFERNRERYEFLKWGQQAFDNFSVVPPATGIIHQVNLEYLAKGVVVKDGVAMPDTLVGTDSHTTMINGLGVLGWGVGGIEAEAVTLGQPYYMLVPEVIGFKLTDALQEGVTATDLVLTVTQMLRAHGVVGKFVEFYGDGLSRLSLPDRATIANMSPEFGATCTFFPVDQETLRYLRGTGRDEELVELVEAYHREQGLWRTDETPEPRFTEVLELDLSTVEASLAGPRRPQDRVALDDMQPSFRQALADMVGTDHPFVGNGSTNGHGDDAYDEADEESFPASDVPSPGSPAARGAANEAEGKEGGAVSTGESHEADDTESFPTSDAPAGAADATGEGEADPTAGGEPEGDEPEAEPSGSVTVTVDGEEMYLKHGSAVIAAITSCTNTSNPSVMMGAGLLAKKAVEKGLMVQPHVKTSLAPGSKVVTEYLQTSGLLDPLEKLRFDVVGYGCTTCIGNSGPLAEEISSAVEENDLVVAAVLSGNRNFEGRINPDVRANYLASPPLVVAYALAGTVDIDLSRDPLGEDSDGNPVYLRDVWPSQEEVAREIENALDPNIYREQYADVYTGNEQWNGVDVPEGDLYEWDPDSTYIQEPSFFKDLDPNAADVNDIEGARVLVQVGDSVTTDHISPAGAIPSKMPAGQYLIEKGVDARNFNSFGSRRGNHEVMVRGTFGNIRLRNKLAGGKEGGYTVHLPDGEETTIYEASLKYAEEGVPLIVLAGKEYGSGSSRDWAAKGSFLLGVKAVIAESFERIHRSNLIGMGVLPVQFAEGENADSLGLTGHESFDIGGLGDLEPGKELTVKATSDDGETKEFKVKARVDSPVEVEYLRNGGILHTVLRQFLKEGE